MFKKGPFLPNFETSIPVPNTFSKKEKACRAQNLACQNNPNFCKYWTNEKDPEVKKELVWSVSTSDVA